jgi:SAM-dependent methyltransferase
MLNYAQLEALCSQPGALSPLTDYLRSSGYTLSGVAHLVEEPDPANFISNAGFCAFVYDEDLKGNSSALALLARMFLMGSRTKSATYRRVFPEKFRVLLETQQLVRPCEDDCVTAEVSIVEFDSRYFLSDKLFENRGNGRIEVQAGRDIVWPMSEWSLNLYRELRINPLWTSMLDVGCGTGCLSILANRRYPRTVGFDLNPRAVAFSRINAALCGAEGVSYETGDCLAFGDSTSRFDHIVFAAPGGPGGGTGESSLVSHGGRLGHELALRFLGERVDALMSAHGCCQIWTIFAVEEKYGSIQELVEHSLPGNRFSVSVKAFRSGGLYLSPDDIKKGKAPPGCHYAKGESAARLVQWLRSNQIKEVASAVVTIQFRQAAGP